MARTTTRKRRAPMRPHSGPIAVEFRFPELKWSRDRAFNIRQAQFVGKDPAFFVTRTLETALNKLRPNESNAGDRVYRAAIKAEIERRAATPLREPAAITVLRPQISKARPGSKAYKIGQLAKRPQGVSSEEALQVTDWRQISVPPNLRACGMSFTTRRVGRSVRYYATAAARP